MISTAGLNRSEAAGLDSTLWKQKYAGRKFEEKGDSGLKPVQAFEYSITEKGKSAEMNPIVVFMVFTGILVAGIVLVVFMIRRVKKKHPANRSTDRTVWQESEAEHEFSESEYQQYVGQGAYREALRLLYRKTLILLARHKLIHIRKEKTNMEYVAELIRHPAYDFFRDLSTAFNRIWYGRRDVSKEEFLRFEQLYESIKNTSGQK